MSDPKGVTVSPQPAFLTVRGNFGDVVANISVSARREGDSLADAAIKEIESAPDRSVAIVAAAFVDDYLKEVIRAAVQKDDKSFADVFGDGKTLGAFGARIDFGFFLGLYDQTLRQELQCIAKIRNRFAHRRGVRCFEDSAVSGLISKLKAGETIETTLTASTNQGTSTSIFRGFISPGMSLKERFIATCNMFMHIFVVLEIGARNAEPIIALGTENPQKEPPQGSQKRGTSRRKS